MRAVVMEGTGKKALVPGYMVGGKTGTAEKQVGGRYKKKALMSSFVAAFPLQDPRYVVLAMLDDTAFRTRAWRGEAIRCHAFYEPIAGYDPEDMPSESDIAEPVVLWLAPFNGGGIHLPVRIRTDSGFGAITIEARSISVEPVAE